MTKRIIPLILFLLIIIVGCRKTANEKQSQATSNTIKKDTTLVFDTVTTPQYDVYCNTRYNYCIKYPKTILIPQGESDNGDGQVFSTQDGENELRVYRDARTITISRNFSIEMAYDQDMAERSKSSEITYHKVDDNFYVLSGYQGENIFYQKTIYRDGELTTAILTYRKGNRAQFDNLIEPIFSSLK
ncbi:MAG: hypothetical protein ACK5MK_12355 [Dysgonomonas sp.]